ncbi:MAG: ATP-binding cassette domain-containing protein [Propionibacteriaceae bacterium]|nr:ATP-binding cassette domain-containing protein [Propionibacteriaceae bacterium]
MSILQASGLHRNFGSVKALKGVDLEVASGQRLGIVGESGSGKTTLIKLLAALDEPDSGEVHFEQKLISGLPERKLGFLRSAVQIVFQDPRSSLNPRMKVGDIICEPLRSSWMRKRLEGVDKLLRLHELLQLVGLPQDCADRYPHEFSGGQRQRIAIARALAPRPEVLIADEPVSALDVSVRAQVINLLATLVETEKLTLIFVSHDLAVVRHLCDSVVVMYSGEIVEQGTRSEVFENPRTDYTQKLLSAIPQLALSGRAR